MSLAGYVRLYRSLLGHVEFRNDAEAMAFAWMIAKAAWAPVCVRYKDRKVELQRGQLSISQRDMARALDRDKGWIERLWRRLENAAMIKADAKAGVAVITICNYSEYQASEGSHKADGKAVNGAGARQAQGTEQGREESKERGKSEDLLVSACAKFPPPPFVSGEQWSDFRKQRKKPLTPRAYTMICNKLTALAEAGYPPGDMIDLAIERGWETVFAPQGTKNGTTHQRNGYGPKPDPTLELLRAANAAQREDRGDHEQTRIALPPSEHG